MKKCPKCGLTNPDEAIVCDCGYNFDTQKITARTIGKPSSGKEVIATYHFKSLLAYGKIFSGFGWVLVVIGFLALVYGLLSVSEGQQEINAILTLGGMYASVVLIVFGFSFVVFGQVISCFVSIERNTRVTFEILKEKD